MIFELILTALFTIPMIIMSAFPNLPATPQVVTDLAESVYQFATSSGWFLNYIYGSFLTTAIFVSLVAIITFDQIYYSAMWVIRKIPTLNIH